MTEDEQGVESAEKRELRPYRRLVVAIFAAVILAAGVFVLRGIVRHLDRLPTVDKLEKPSVVDVRGLRACAEDLDRLETRVREGAGKMLASLSRDQERMTAARELTEELSLELLRIVARCRLHEVSSDPVVADLEAAANELELMIRAFAVLYDRHAEDVLPHSVEARRTLERATAQLRER